MMAQALPATVEELNSQQSLKAPTLLQKKSDFEDIRVEKRIKRLESLPSGVQNWNISNFDSYLNFDETLEYAVINSYDVLASPEDRLVPETDLRDRSSSISSVCSMLDDKQITFHNFGVKTTINTVSMDSGSTCIASDHTYYGKNSENENSLISLDPGETYQDLDRLIQRVPEVQQSEVLASSSFTPLTNITSEDSLEYTVLDSLASLNDSTMSNDSSIIQNFSYPSTSTSSSSVLKRPLDTIDEDDVFTFKQPRRSSEKIVSTRYHENRRRNNISSKNCRKTRKEKQKDMEMRLCELEQQNGHLKVQAQVLEELIEAHKRCLLNAISQKR